MSMVNAVVMRRIQKSYIHQTARWGRQDHDDAYWFMIVMEELGEAAQACKKGVTGGDHSMEDELTSVAAMIIHWLERIEERKVSL